MHDALSLIVCTSASQLASTALMSFTAFRWQAVATQFGEQMTVVLRTQVPLHKGFPAGNYSLA
jgi:hypothetical protein